MRTFDIRRCYEKLRKLKKTFGKVHWAPHHFMKDFFKKTRTNIIKKIFSTKKVFEIPKRFIEKYSFILFLFGNKNQFILYDFEKGFDLI